MPFVATVLCTVCVAWLLWREARIPTVSPGSWVVFAWLGILGSRPVASWFGMGGGYADTTAAYLEGSPVDRMMYLMIIAAGMVVLAKRKLDWKAVIRQNQALALAYVYFLITTLWADHPFVAFKRWFKEFGNVILVLVVITESQPITALRSIYRRCAYVLFPFSVLLILYYPKFGRYYSVMGEPLNCGVTHSKNSLGEIAFVFGLVLLWEWLEVLKPKIRSLFRADIAARMVILLAAVWLLIKSKSATAVLCAAIGVAVLCSRWLPVIRNNRKAFIKVFSVGLVILVILQANFNVIEVVVGMLGRDMTFTGRTEIWEIVGQQKINPLIGVGFSSFWSSHHAQVIWDEFITLVSAHNGYLDVYLDGGYIGLGVLALVLLSVFRRVIRNMGAGQDLAILQFAFLLLIIVRNCSETNFFRGNALWFTFLLLAMASTQFAPPFRNRMRPRPRPATVMG